MRTIFFLLPTGITVRNFLFTGCIDRVLAHEEVRVVVFTQHPEALAAHTRGSDRLLVEAFPPRRRCTVSNLMHAVLRRRFYRTHETASSAILAKGPLSQQLREVIVENVLSQPFPRSRTIYERLRAFEASRLTASPQVREAFARFEPDLLVSTHPTAMDDYEFLSYARTSGVASVGAIKSWDIMTTKGYIPVAPDYYLVWNDIMKQEIMTLHRVPSDRIGVTGVPQFDPYADRAGVRPRAEFLRRWRLDPAKKVILYCTSPPYINPDDPEVVRRLARSQREAGDPVQILARLHQLDDVQRYRQLSDPDVAIHVPGTDATRAGDHRLLDPGFVTELRDTLYHADVVVNTCSTTSLDAAAMDRPAVSVAFDLVARDYYRSVRRYYDFDHFQPISRSGATRVAWTFDDLVADVRHYLRHPESEAAERRHLRETMCYQVDGRAGDRLAAFLHAQLGLRRSAEALASA